MKKLLLLLSIYLTFSTLLSAQKKKFEWAFAGGGSDADYISAVANMSPNFLIAGGFFLNTVDFDPSDGVANLTSNGLKDAFIMKVDTNRNFQWVKRIGGTGNETISDIAVDNNNNILVLGKFASSTVDFDPGPGTFNLSYSGSGDDIFVLKLDQNGNFIWAKKWGNGALASATNFSVDDNGNVFVAFYTYSTIDVDPGPATLNYSTLGLNDGYIVKLDTDGSFAWANRIGGTGNDYTQSIATDAAGSCYISGMYFGTVDFDPSPSTANLTASPGGGNYLVKYSSTGAYEWVIEQVQNNQGTAANHKLFIDNNNNIYLCCNIGSIGDNGDFDPGSGTYNLPQGQFFVQKLANDKSFIWAKMFKTNPSYSYAVMSMYVNENEEVALTGYFNDTIGMINQFLYTAPASTSVNSFTILLNADGSFQWLSTIVGPNYEYGFDCYLSANGSLYTGGTLTGTTDLDPGPMTYNLSSNGAQDFFMQKLVPCLPITSDIVQTACGTYNWNGTIYNTSGDYNKTFQSYSGCDSVVTLHLTIYPIDTTTMTAEICTGDSYDFFGTNLTQANTYYHTLTSSHNCDSVIKLTLTEKPLPTVVANTTATHICSGMQVTLFGSGADNYTWDNGVTDGVAFNPTSTTTYTVTGTASNGCQNTATIVVYVSTIAGDLNCDGVITPPEIAGDVNGDGVITPPEITGDVNGDGEIVSPEIAGDVNGDGEIILPEIAGDINGDGEIISPEIAGDINGDGEIILPEIAGDVNGDGEIVSPEIAGDVNGDGDIVSPEIAGDVNGDGEIILPEIAGDINGDGEIISPEIAGDVNGDGEIVSPEIAGDVNGDGDIVSPEIAGDVNGDGEIILPEIAGDINGDGEIISPEIAGDTNGDEEIDITAEICGDNNGDGIIDGTEICGDGNGDISITGFEICGDINGNKQINENETCGDVNGDISITGYEICGDINGNKQINENEICGDVNGDISITGYEICGDINGNKQIDENEICGDIDGDEEIDTTAEICGDLNGDSIIDGTEICGDINGNTTIDAGDEVAGDANGNGNINGTEIAGDNNGNGTIERPTEICGDVDGNGTIELPELCGDINGDFVITPPEILGDANGNLVLDPEEMVAVNNIIDNQNISLVPTIVTDVLTIKINGNIEEVKVIITSANGKKLFTKNMTDNCVVDMSNYPGGLYMVQLQSNNWTIYRKVVKR